eukprot:CAMPEP_0115269540 /NCGR_PEP_ID=MMETSP0270-20121206/53095_1 /TAXON_ID=71861 /ORGANISM="Scrippsiella trochoidea, Strain CCMP3099" /LENGTH=48 /DNA_ID= /DNA_START= /DNA_END= /DNA_ORIENTATION=
MHSPDRAEAKVRSMRTCATWFFEESLEHPNATKTPNNAENLRLRSRGG